MERLGGYLRELQVRLDPTRMSARGVTLELVVHAIEDTNENAAGGFLAREPAEWTVRAIGRIASVDDLRHAVTARREGFAVLVGDVADVREAGAVGRGMAHRLNGEVVSLRISKQFGADTVTVAQHVRIALEDVRKVLPKGVALKTVYDQSTLVHSSLQSVAKSIGAALVIGVLLLLGDVRAAFLVVLTLPLADALERRWVGNADSLSEMGQPSDGYRRTPPGARQSASTSPPPGRPGCLRTRSARRRGPRPARGR